MKSFTLAKSAGFCFGVNKAVECVYENINKHDSPLILFGSIINNKNVNDELISKGVKIVNDVCDVNKNDLVVIRSHGVSPGIYDKITEIGANYIDCTCIFVKKIHEIVKNQYDNGNSIIIIGDSTHPEVIGINGWANNSAFIVDTVEKAENLDILSSAEIAIVSQTTFIKSNFDAIVRVIKGKHPKVLVHSTICRATMERQDEARTLSKDSDIMIVGGGDSRLYPMSHNMLFKVKLQKNFLPALE